jgi:hypothetical protein
MSKYGWESGTLKLPSAAWAPFKKALQEGMSKHKERDYELAVKLHAALVEQKKGKRGFDLQQAFDAEYSATVQSNSFSRWGGGGQVPKYPFKTVEYYDLKPLILGKQTTPTLYKPQKKDFPKCTSATLAFSGDSCGVNLNNATREVTWCVEDNNHSVDSAHESPLGQLTFQLLGQVKWTRATGGTICGNDEYNRDQQGEGGGGNYVSHRFGPLGEYEIPSYLRPSRKGTAKTPAAKRK